MFKIGIDLGGTKIEGIVLDENSKEVTRKRIPNGKEKGYENIINNIKKLYNDLLKSIDSQSHTLGLGTPGSISKETGLLKNCNIQLMNGQPFREDLEKSLNHKIAVENDANCFALAEALIGAGKGENIVFGIIIGTGCGGGLVINGQVIQGMKGNTGEWGHSTINYEGDEWYTVKGAVEGYISGTGIETQYKRKFGIQVSSADIVSNYRKGDEKAKEVMNAFFKHFGISVANLIKFLDPDVIVLGGGVSNVDELYTEGIERVKKYVFKNDLYTPIVKNHYGDSAGVFGAALIGIN